MEGSSPAPGSPGGPSRALLHVDMDAFYAAIEARDDPSLLSRPVVVGADPQSGRGRGVVCTANYAARAFGIRSAMPISKAWDLCPQAVYLRPDFTRYSKVSRDVMDVLRRYADVLEVVGMDEAYLDVTSRCLGEDGSVDWSLVSCLARSLQAAVKRDVGISCSVGAATSKSVAKVASDHRKPHGVTVVPGETTVSFLDPLPVRRLVGCGPKTAARLKEEGFHSIGDLARATRTNLVGLLGSSGAWLWDLANGKDDRPVTAHRGHAKSHSNERTFQRDEPSSARVLETASRLGAGLVEDARDDERAFATVTVKLRYRDYRTLTRSRSFDHPLEPANQESLALVNAAVRDLLRPLLDDRPIRLVGVRLSSFRDALGQQALSAYGLEWAGLRDPALHAPALAPGPRDAFLPGIGVV